MWRTVDYFLRGQLCPVKDIRESASRLREQLGVRYLILIACDRKNILRSLTSLSSASPSDELSFERGIGETDFLNVETRINSLVPTIAFAPRRRRDDESLLLEELERLLAPNMGQQLATSIRRLSILRVAKPLDHVLVRPLLLVGPDQQVKRNAISREDAEQLLAMLNATTQATARVDVKVMDDVDKWLVPDVSSDGAVNFAEMARRASGLAVDVTESACAAVYLQNPESRQALQLIAWESAEGSLVTEEQFDGEPRTDVLIKRVIERHRARQWTDATSTKCATPIPGPLGSPHGPAIGCLLIVRMVPKDFSAYDLALARNVCLRLAILHSTSASGSIAQTVTDLRRPLTTASSTGLDGVGMLGDPDLPPDIRLGLARLPTALERVAISTNSHSVSVQLALPDPETPEPHGLSLRTVTAFPRAEASNTEQRQRQGRDAGLNWQTVLSGGLTYSPRAESKGGTSRLGEGTESELSVPIRVDGRLIGTLNLQSRTLNNYGPFLPQVQALAGAIARNFADAVAYHNQPVLERAAEILDKAHDYEGKLRGLKRRASHLKLDEKSLRAIDEYIEDCLALIQNTTRKEFESDESTQRATIEQILVSALAKRYIPLLEMPDASGLPEFQFEIEGEKAKVLLAATHNILSNLKNHSGKPGIAHRRATGRLREVKFDSCVWDNRHHATIRFENLSGDYILKPTAYQVYRVPIRGSNGELRLGAYLASVRLRQIGGMIHFSVVEHDQRARTIMMVPTNDVE